MPDPPARVQVNGGDPVDAAVGSLVVGFDPSPASHEALRTAVDLGGRLHATVHVVHAIDLDDYPVDSDADDWERRLEETLGAEREAVSRALAGYRYGWSFHAVRAAPATALTHAGHEFDALFVVVGASAHGLRRLLDRLTPSVPHQLVDHAERPVLVVAHRPPSLGRRS